MSHAILNDPAVCEASLKARQQFSKNANVFASLKNSPDDVFEIVMSDLALSKQFRDELEDFGRPEVIHQQDLGARAEGRKYLQQVIYEAICQSFMRVFTRGAIRLAMKLTDAANKELLEIRYAAGELQRPPVARKRTPQEILDDQIREDWAHLPTDKLKKNADPRYRARLTQMLETDELKAQISALTDGSKL